MTEKTESVTAKLCAYARAWHSNKSRHKIFDDYLAYDMMGKQEYDQIYNFIRHGFSDDNTKIVYSHDQIEEILVHYIAPIPLARIGFSESRLKRFASDNDKVQCVICGAGADSFSFRNTNTNIEIFEIDHPDTQRYKRSKIRQLEWNIPNNVHFVPVDFEKEKMQSKLLKAGFDPGIKTFFSILGVSYYLSLPVFEDTLTAIADLSAMGSVLTFDYPEKELNNSFPERIHKLEQLTASLGEKMQGGFSYNEISRALYRLGFQIDTYMTPSKIQESYFSDRTDGLRAFENVNLISATYTGGFDYE